MLAIALMLVANPLGRLSTAFAYSCTGHCYANAYTLYSNTITGAGSYIQGVRINCSGCGGNNFINNETWLIDNAHGSSCQPFGRCWVEGGYTSTPNYGGTPYYFYAYARPTNIYQEFPISLFISSDYSQAAYFIYELNSSQYNVVISNSTSGFNATETVTTSAHQTQEIQFGQELTGTGGASAPNASFNYNQYHTSSGWYYQGPANTIFYNPPYGAYSYNSTGGTLTTHCC